MRAEAVAALGVVDYVAITPGPNAVEAIHLIHPDFLIQTSGDEEINPHLAENIALEDKVIQETGGQVIFIPNLPTSPNQANYNFLSYHSPEIHKYLNLLTEKHSTHQVLDWLYQGKNLRVLVVGEAIIDEYQYCETIGKSGKEPILAARYLHTETFSGGIMAIANNVAAFCDQVDMLTILGRPNGKPDSAEEFIRSRLKSNINPIFLYQDGAPTIIKRRFVENYPLQKLFEIYIMEHIEENSPLIQQLCQELENRLADYDLVIVGDYGHGMLPSASCRYLKS